MATLSNPVAVLQNTTVTNDLSNDGYTWANTLPIVTDKFGKLTVWVQRINGGNKRQAPSCSNDNGATWTDPTISGCTDAAGEGFLVRGAVAYDSRNDLMHILWTDENALILYRRYSFTRDGSNNVTGITRDASVNLVLDPTSGSFSFGWPTIVWRDDGTNGQLICGWVATNGAGTPNKCEIRLSMRVLSNSSADNTAGNWVSPTGSGSTASNGITPNVAYYAVAGMTAAGIGAMALARKTAGTNADDLYVAWFDLKSGSSTSEYDFARLKWNSGSANWSNGQTATQTLSLIQVAGTDGGYTQKFQLTSKWVEDTANDLMYIGFAVWKDNTAGDTWSFKSINAAAADTMSSRVDVYSAGGAHSFAPTGDVMFDTTAGRAVVSYIKTSTQFAYVTTWNNTTADQAETLLFNTDTVDIPLLNTVRINNKLASVFRESTGAAPFVGYFVSMDWSSPITTPVSTRICVV